MFGLYRTLNCEYSNKIIKRMYLHIVFYFKFTYLIYLIYLSDNIINHVTLSGKQNQVVIVAKIPLYCPNHSHNIIIITSATTIKNKFQRFINFLQIKYT